MADLSRLESSQLIESESTDSLMPTLLPPQAEAAVQHGGGLVWSVLTADRHAKLIVAVGGDGGQQGPIV